MDVAQSPPLSAGCLLSYCKNISYCYPEGYWDEQKAEAHDKDTSVLSLPPHTFWAL